MVKEYIAMLLLGSCPGIIDRIPVPLSMKTTPGLVRGTSAKFGGSPNTPSSSNVGDPIKYTRTDQNSYSSVPQVPTLEWADLRGSFPTEVL